LMTLLQGQVKINSGADLKFCLSREMETCFVATPKEKGLLQEINKPAIKKPFPITQREILLEHSTFNKP